ncbi:MAG TPA: FAD:protein FMN transferase [Dehalococcoidia bacterium]|nr:FAD:protein FMN transferase [Dehalococcoidia bacterium]
MNTDITLVSCRADGERRLDRAERWLHAFERRFSRFLPESELSRLNAAAGAPFRASPPLLRLVRLARDFARESGGLFDPAILRQLEAAGYDRSFEQIPLARPPDPRHAASRATWRNIVVDAPHHTITLPADAGIDLGGIGKGWAVDRVAAILGSPCLVNCGGDVFAAGVPPKRGAWRVGVADPFAPDDDLLVLAVEDRGVATSSSVKRRWKVGDRYLHHLIDPRTGGPSESDAVQVTVVARTAVLADYHAKVALLSGVQRGLSYLDDAADVEGLVVAAGGARHQSRGFHQYVVP